VRFNGNQRLVTRQQGNVTCGSVPLQCARFAGFGYQVNSPLRICYLFALFTVPTEALSRIHASLRVEKVWRSSSNSTIVRIRLYACECLCLSAFYTLRTMLPINIGHCAGLEDECHLQEGLSVGLTQGTRNGTLILYN